MSKPPRLASVWTVALACALGASTQIGAQSPLELAGGWGIAAGGHGLPGEKYGGGLSFRASLVHDVNSRVSLRFDGTGAQFDHTEQWYHPCPSPGCTGPSFLIKTNSIVGLTANALIALDARKIFYVLAGAGAYVDWVPDAEQHIGVSVGAGMVIPAGIHLHAVIEVRRDALLGGTSGPTSVMPITIGFRFR